MICVRGYWRRYCDNNMKHYTGVDIIEISRIRNTVDEWGERFLQRIFTDAEQALCHRKAHSLAVRFAGKEAVMKLLGTGIIGIRWRDIEILAYDTGKPRLQLYGGAKRKAEELGLEDIAISLSHSDEYAIATAFSTSKR